MVLDPLSAFALACNVIQMIEVGFKTLSKAAEYRQSTDGQTAEQRELRDVARTLGNLTLSLQTSLDHGPKSNSASVEETRLIEANDECLKLSREFTLFLDKLKVKDRHTTLASLHMSIKARWYKDRTNAMQQTLSEARDNLNIAFLIYMHAQQATILAQTRDKVEASGVNVEHNILTAIDSSTGHIQDEILKLAEHLKETYLDSGEQTATGFVSNNQDIFGDIAAQLKAIHTSQTDAASSKAEDRSLIAQQNILNSLHFGQINDRREQIRTAHSQTYQWMLHPLTQGWQRWHCFTTWMQSPDSHQRLYWIHGKPGSGKSTLMRFLDENIRKDDHMSAWAKHDTVVKACCYFWTAGNELQRSLQGLYRSLLFQLLERNPSMISQVVSQRDWKVAQISAQAILKEWTSSELRNMLSGCLRSAQMGTKFLFLIDGLDEFHGTDEEQTDLLDYLLSLATSENVKICVSSRPLNVFRDSLGDFPQLRLEDLTRGDIEIYVASQLTNSNRWCYFERHYSKDARILADEIVSKASGVFLWVRLVIRDLLRGLRDGDGLGQLMQKLEHIPADLDDYFLSIINSIEPTHRREASAMLQLALFRETEFTTLHSLTVMDISFIEEEDEDFAITHKHDFNYSDLLDHQSLAFRYDSTVRKLNSRCMGLLEVVPSSEDWVDELISNVNSNFEDTDMEDSAASTPVQSLTGEESNPTLNFDAKAALYLRASMLYRVEFLHRSLHDFLLTDRMQAFLHHYTNGPFNARAFLRSARFRHFMAAMHSKWQDDLAIGLASYLLSALSVDETTATSITMTKMMKEPMTDLAGRMMRVGLPRTRWYINRPLATWQQEGSSFLTLAIEFRLTSYLLPLLTPQVIKHKARRPVLDYILRPRVNTFNRRPNISLLKAVLDNGADPNEIYTNMHASVWALFLNYLWYEKFMLTKGKYPEEMSNVYHSVLKLVIEAGASPMLPTSYFSATALADKSDTRLLNSYWLPARTACEHWERRCYGQTSTDLDTDAESHDTYYAASEILHMLRPRFKFSIDELIHSMRRQEPDVVTRRREENQR